MKNKQKGFIVPLLSAIIVLLAVGGGYFYIQNKNIQNNTVSTSTKASIPVVSRTQDSNKNTSSATSPTTLSNTEKCKRYAQKDADSYNTSTKSYYSVQSYHYSSLDSACYFELHYQMNTDYQGNTYVSQVYQISAVSKDSMNFYLNNVGAGANSPEEASCIVPETYYQGVTTDCKYYGLEYLNDSTVMMQKYSIFDGVPMSHSDYKTLLQKRMNN